MCKDLFVATDITMNLFPDNHSLAFFSLFIVEIQGKPTKAGAG